jgi:hypothetical protein
LPKKASKNNTNDKKEYLKGKKDRIALLRWIKVK